MIMIEDLWGKTNPFESAISHMLRVGYIFNVGVRKSNLNKVYNQLKESVKIINEVDFLNFISYYLSLHDIGKISPFFQSKDLKMKELLKKENLYVSNISGFRHEYQSEEYIKNIFNKYFDEYIEEEDINSFAAVSALHHYKSGKYEMITNQRKLKIWNDFVDDCEKKIRQVFNFKTVGFSKIIKKDCFFYSLLGLLIICDWLASKENKIDINQFLKSEDRVIEILEKNGFKIINNERLKGIDYQNILGIKNPILTNLQDWTLKDNECFDMLIIESGTGSGKTSVGLYEVFKNLQENEGVFYALPTKSMVNSKYKQLKSILSSYSIPVVLLHGDKWLLENEDFNISDKDLNNKLNSMEVNDFLMNDNRCGLFNSYIVCTIDQLLQAVLPNKFNILRLIGLIGKTIILDEIHAYDLYTSSLICRFLNWCKVFGIKVILMSATLPKSTKEKYIKEYIGKEVKLNNQGYPLITKVISDNIIEYELEDKKNNNKKIEIALEPLLSDLSSQVDYILNFYNQNDVNIVVYKNTIKSAQNLYLQLKEKGVENLYLSHSKFKMEDRDKKDNFVLSHYGADEGKRLKKSILVCTSVYEACLDLSFDVCFTDIAPIDSLIQRWGRLCRFDRDKVNKTIIFVDKNKNYEEVKPYEPFLIVKTHTFLEKYKTLKFPENIRMAIEYMFNSEDNDNNFFDLKMQQEIKEKLQLDSAFSSCIAKPNNSRCMIGKKAYIFFDEEETFSKKTRDFIETKRVVFIDKSCISLYDTYKRNPTIENYKKIIKQSFTVYPYEISKDDLQNTNDIIVGEGILKNSYICFSENNRIVLKNKILRYDEEIGFYIEKGV